MQAMRQYYYGQQSIDSSDIAAVAEATNSSILSQGDALIALEKRVADYCGAKHCIAVANGTAALHLSCLALNMCPGEMGLTSAMTFVADANAIRWCGAEVDFIDIDPNTFNITPELLEGKLAQLANKGIHPTLLIVTHFAGLSCNMREIGYIAKKHNMRVIEDACHALGGDQHGRKIGGCEYSDTTVFSLHPVKSITSGEGGLIVTNDDMLASRVRLMRSHSIERANGGDDAPWRAEMTHEGFNYRIAEPLCALALSQMQKLDSFIKKRRELARHYRKKLANTGVGFQFTDDPDESAWHIFIGLFDENQVGIGKRALFDSMRARGINLMVHYLPVPQHRFYIEKGFSSELFPEANRYYRNAFSLPLHPNLEVDDINHICEAIQDIISL